MPRRREVPKREILPDPVYGSELISRLVNKLMWDGKKSTAYRNFYRAMKIIEERTGEDPIKVFKAAVENAKPFMETKSRRVGGSTYQVPIEVSPRRRTALGLRWLVNATRARGEKTVAARLANELIEAANNRGGAVRKREDVHRMAEANRAFAHYRW
ncbi:MAG: 30S ribosomal protein S7 [Acidobacteriota bacterium]|nr:MAG: 30S ribosomal protein S7 [Acidobacteriota bacterium]